MSKNKTTENTEDADVGEVGALTTYFYPQYSLSVVATSKKEADKKAEKLAAKSNDK